MRAVRASTQPRGNVCVYCGPMYKVRENMMIVFCFICFRCPAVCSVLYPTSVTLNESRTYAYARHAHNCLRGRIFLCAGTCALEPFGAAFCFFTVFTFLLPVYFCFSLFCVFLFTCTALCFFFTFIGLILLMKCVLLLLVHFTVSCLLLLSLCVDGALVCAEGYTQVTGMMAMMMTGRVLLVCALCVLLCVAVFGVAADDAGDGDGSACENLIAGRRSQLRRECAEEVGRRTGGRANASAVEECVRRGMD
ncbi:mucin-associated surface protein (MASP), putative, partial [Trypanosoma cruzi]